MQLLTIADLSRVLKLSVRSIYRLQKDGDLPAAIRIGPRAARWKRLISPPLWTAALR